MRWNRKNFQTLILENVRKAWKQESTFQLSLRVQKCHRNTGLDIGTRLATVKFWHLEKLESLKKKNQSWFENFKAWNF